MHTSAKLSDMGTTGLIDYVAGQRGGRRIALAKINAERVLRGRYATNPGEAVRRFRLALADAQAKVTATRMAEYAARAAIAKPEDR